jgi:hypothetical protein
LSIGRRIDRDMTSPPRALVGAFVRDRSLSTTSVLRLRMSRPDRVLLARHERSSQAVRRANGEGVASIEHQR